MEDKAKYIKYFRVEGLWNRINIDWEDINEDVNILVGINGCGKTTLLNLINEYYSGQKIKKGLVESVCGNQIGSPVSFIRSFDVPSNTRKKTESNLLQELKNVINQNGDGNSFFDYRMMMLNYPEQSDKIRRRIENFFCVIDSLFGETGKKITIDTRTNSLAFSINETMIQLEQLSSGEKQLLLILTTVFLQDERPFVLLMDEPEISLHISWQDSLVSMLRKLNPNCQLIITTHSPNIFANGWEDKIVFLEDLEA